MPRPSTTAPPDLAARCAILGAADRQLRRFGPEKLTILDIAREAGMSHPNLYRFFASKAAILDAVVARWLDCVTTPLTAIAQGPGTATERLAAFMMERHRIKVRKMTEDAELFRAYGAALRLAGREAIEAHLAAVADLMTGIIAEGVANGEFAADLDPAATAATLREATAGFHNPELIPGALAVGHCELRLERLVKLLVAGLRP